MNAPSERPATTPHPEPAALAEPTSLCPTQTLRRLSEGNALLVDVREHDEVAALAFDVPMVVHIPLSEFERRFAELPRERELITACASGQRSLKAAYYLIYQGYRQVAHMEEGMAKWLRKGFPVHTAAISGTAKAGVGGCCSPGAGSGGCCDEAAPAVDSGIEASRGCCGASSAAAGGCCDSSECC